MSLIENIKKPMNRRQFLIELGKDISIFLGAGFLNALNTVSADASSDAKPYSLPVEYKKENTTRKISLPKIIMSIENREVGFDSPPKASKKEEHIMLEQEFFNDIEKIKGNELAKTARIFEYVTKRLPFYKNAKDEKYGDASLGELLECECGKCNDKANVLYEAYKSAGIKADVLHGDSFFFGIMVGKGHSWTRVYVEVEDKKACIDLDPTWYEEFTPIRPTTEFSEIKLCSFEGQKKIITEQEHMTEYKKECKVLTPEEYLREWAGKSRPEIKEIIDKYTLLEGYGTN